MSDQPSFTSKLSQIATHDRCSQASPVHASGAYLDQGGPVSNLRCSAALNIGVRSNFHAFGGTPFVWRGQGTQTAEPKDATAPEPSRLLQWNFSLLPHVAREQAHVTADHKTTTPHSTALTAVTATGATARVQPWPEGCVRLHCFCLAMRPRLWCRQHQGA